MMETIVQNGWVLVAIGAFGVLLCLGAAIALARRGNVKPAVQKPAAPANKFEGKDPFLARLERLS